jgi:hypothetical protein
MVKEILEGIKQFISIDRKDPTKLRINFDEMCIYLVQVHKRKFSPMRLERALNNQIEKHLIGRTITPEVFTGIALYIDKKTKWLALKDREHEALRAEESAWIREAAKESAESGDKTEYLARISEVRRRRLERGSED